MGPKPINPRGMHESHPVNENMVDSKVEDITFDMQSTVVHALHLKPNNPSRHRQETGTNQLS